MGITFYGVASAVIIDTKLSPIVPCLINLLISSTVNSEGRSQLRMVIIFLLFFTGNQMFTLTAGASTFTFEVDGSQFLLAAINTF